MELQDANRAPFTANCSDISKARHRIRRSRPLLLLIHLFAAGIPEYLVFVRSIYALLSLPSALCCRRVGLRVVYGVRVCINIAGTAAAAVPLPPRCSLLPSVPLSSQPTVAVAFLTR